MFIGKPDGIIMRMRGLTGMVEAGCSLGGGGAESVTEDGYRKRAIVLRTASHNPMTVAESLHQGVLIIIRCNTFLFCILCLRCPEVLTVGHQHCGQGLSVFLAPFPEETGCAGVRLSRPHHCIQGAQLPEVFECVDPLGNSCFQVIPSVIATAGSF